MQVRKSIGYGREELIELKVFPIVGPSKRMIDMSPIGTHDSKTPIPESAMPIVA